MFSLNGQVIPLASSTGVDIEKHITVQKAAEITDYNVQYLRRLLRDGKLEAIKIGHIWLISLASLNAYFNHAISSNDLRFGPKGNWQPPF